LKRGGPNHPKTYALAESLGIRRAHAVGILEMLFHFTAQYAPEGDIGRYSDKRIAAALDWHASPTKLIDALAATGWIDTHHGVGWVVHGWSEHADRSVVQRLTRAGKKPIQSNHEDTAKVKPQCADVGNQKVHLAFSAVEFDHYIPIAKGGKHERNNIRVSCLQCNRSKAAKVPEEVCYQVV